MSGPSRYVHHDMLPLHLNNVLVYVYFELIAMITNESGQPKAGIAKS